MKKKIWHSIIEYEYLLPLFFFEVGIMFYSPCNKSKLHLMDSTITCCRKRKRVTWLSRMKIIKPYDESNNIKSTPLSSIGIDADSPYTYYINGGFMTEDMIMPYKIFHVRVLYTDTLSLEEHFRRKIGFYTKLLLQ